MATIPQEKLDNGGFYSFSWEFPHSKSELDPDGIQYEIMRWEDFYGMADELAEIVLSSRRRYDCLVYPLRGGIFPATVIGAALNIRPEPIGIRLYKGIQARDEAKREEVELYHPLNSGLNLKGARVLVADDVNHTTETLLWLTAHLRDEHHAASVQSAVLHEKPAFRQAGADCVVRHTNSWIVYPWEHLGSELHLPGEFFAEKFPVWMIRNDGLASWGDCLSRALQIGFWKDELPDLENDNFRGRFLPRLVKRYQELYNIKTEIPQELLEQILP